MLAVLLRLDTLPRYIQSSLKFKRHYQYSLSGIKTLARAWSRRPIALRYIMPRLPIPSFLVPTRISATICPQIAHLGRLAGLLKAIEGMFFRRKGDTALAIGHMIRTAQDRVRKILEPLRDAVEVWFPSTDSSPVLKCLSFSEVSPTGRVTSCRESSGEWRVKISSSQGRRPGSKSVHGSCSPFNLLSKAGLERRFGMSQNFRKVYVGAAVYLDGSKASPNFRETLQDAVEVRGPEAH